VNSKNVPFFLRWLPKASLIKQGFEALAVNEFKGTTFVPDAATGGGYQTGEAVLKWLSFGSNVEGSLVRLGKITAFYYVAAYRLVYGSIMGPSVIQGYLFFSWSDHPASQTVLCF
jgi:hypothetical protein